MTDSWVTHCGDCLATLQCLPENSFDSVVTDSPYSLSFMGKNWDRESPSTAVWAEVLRVAKPGAHLLTFGGTRTFHRLICAIEDAGWEIRDCLMWLHGQGFPKSRDISKAIDKNAGAEREIIGTQKGKGGENLNQLSRLSGNDSTDAKGCGAYGQGAKQIDISIPITVPSTDEAKQWGGWGTALKPAWEPIILARKPIAEKTIAANVLAHGTGAINIDGCRIGTEEVTINTWDDGAKPFGDGAGHPYTSREQQGRWPANLILDGEAAAMLDEQSGELKSGVMKAGQQRKKTKGLGGYHGNFPDEATQKETYGDTGGASRFFYTAKASKKERNLGLPEGTTNDHPTVKPVKLMQWLTRLVTPPQGVILDLFMGSGTTGMAAVSQGFGFYGIDSTPKYVEISKARIQYAATQELPQ